MAAMTVRNIPDDLHKALKRRAKVNGRSAEAELRAILVEAISRESKVGLGTALAELGRKFGGVELEIDRSKHPVRYVDFSLPAADTDAAE